jgi:hypothetical protein
MNIDFENEVLDLTALREEQQLNVCEVCLYEYRFSK